MHYKYEISNIAHPTPGNGLFQIRKDGQLIDAYATKGVFLGNHCDIRGGVFHGGIFYGGDFRSGVFCGGRFYDGDFRGGRFYGGAFHDGVFRGGSFHGGVFRDGIFCGGRFYDGDFYGGRFHGGVFRDGIFCGGAFYDGWLPLQIQGSRHFVNIPDGENIKIGCKIMSYEDWMEKGLAIAQSEGYTKDQIAEYTRYIEIAQAMIQSHNT